MHFRLSIKNPNVGMRFEPLVTRILSHATGSLSMVELVSIAVAPEVVFEVRSPTDRWPKVLEKVGEYLNAGVLAVYVVDPQAETVTMFDADQPGQTQCSI